MRCNASVFAVDDARGVVGPLALPQHEVWVGLAFGDTLFAADARGTLYRAATVDGALSAVNSVSTALDDAAGGVGAAHWDASGTMVVAVLQSMALISTDAGVSFRASEPQPGLVLETIVARYDGVIVVQGQRPSQLKAVADWHAGLAEIARKNPKQAFAADVPARLRTPTTLISRDRGAHWKQSAWQPERVRREGAFIVGAVQHGAEQTQKTLAKDGATWRAGDLIPDTRSWSEAMKVSHDLVARARPTGRMADSAPDAPDPKPPAPLPPKPGVITLESVSDGQPPTCHGADCIREVQPKEPTPTRHAFHLMSDGECAARDASSDGVCLPGAPLMRSPKISILDRADETVKLAAAPDGCRPVRAYSVMGMGLLICDTANHASASVFFGDPQARWHADGGLPVPARSLEHVSMAEDGTLMLHEACTQAGRCGAWLRRPVLVGEKTAWKRVELVGAFAYRPAPSGRVLAVVSDDTDEKAFSLALLDDELSARWTSPRLSVAAPLRDAYVQRGQIVIETRNDWLGQQRFVVGPDGSLTSMQP